MVTVYRKSAKGQLEIETRVNRLHPRLRTVLILVDGRRNDDELRSLIQVDADATLLALIEGGYIEVSAGAAPVAVDLHPFRAAHCRGRDLPVVWPAHQQLVAALPHRRAFRPGR